jgi:hypothetical protein
VTKDEDDGVVGSVWVVLGQCRSCVCKRPAGRAESLNGPKTRTMA